MSAIDVLRMCTRTRNTTTTDTLYERVIAEFDALTAENARLTRERDALNNNVARMGKVNDQMDTELHKACLQLIQSVPNYAFETAIRQRDIYRSTARRLGMRIKEALDTSTELVIDQNDSAPYWAVDADALRDILRGEGERPAPPTTDIAAEASRDAMDAAERMQGQHD